MTLDHRKTGLYNKNNNVVDTGPNCFEAFF